MATASGNEHDLKVLAEKVDKLAEALADSEKRNNRRHAQAVLTVRDCQSCLNQIKTDTQGIQEMKDDAEHAMRLIVVIRKGLVWIIGYIVLPIATLVALLYVAIHGDWPKWFDMLKDTIT